MLRIAIALIAFTFIGSTAQAQCVNGVCKLRATAPPPVVYQPQTVYQPYQYNGSYVVPRNYHTPVRKVLFGWRAYPTPVRTSILGNAWIVHNYQPCPR